MRKSNTEFCSAENIAENEDLLTQLLIRLPPRSLIRSKCVSKYWLSLISTPKFCTSHTLLNPNPRFSSFFLDRSLTTPSLISLPSGTSSTPLNFISDPQGIKILQSCNGFLLCCSSDETSRKFYVVNPTTAQFLELPPPPDSDASARLFSMVLAFDPSKSLHYKVVSVSGFGADPTKPFQIGIYSSETRSWKVCESIKFWFPATADIQGGVYCNGMINWLTRFCWLLYYDIEQGDFGVVHEYRGENDDSMEREGGKNPIYFGESGGHLQIVQLYRHYPNQLKVLEMGTDYSGWFVKYDVDLSLMRAAFPETHAGYYPFFVIYLAVEENEENPSVLLHIPDKIIYYDLKHGTFMKLCDLRGCFQIGWRDAYHHKETLACV